MAAFTALTLALRAVPAPPVMHGMFRLVAFPIILSGFVLGPRAGFWVGAVSDVLGYIMFPTGPFFPGFTITQALTGYIPAAAAGAAPYAFKRVLLGTACGQLITNCLLVPLFLCILYVPEQGYAAGWAALAAASIPAQLLHIPLYAWLTVCVLKHLPAAEPQCTAVFEAEPDKL